MKSTFGQNGHLYLLGATVVLLLLFGRLYLNILPGLNQTRQAMVEGEALTLQPGLKAASIRQLLRNGDYYSDPKDIALVADSLVSQTFTYRFAR